MAEADGSAPPPAEDLLEELIEEVLLRYPPSDPARLVHAALVCKRWCRLLSGPGFRRRFRALHRAPPMLGFLCNAGLGSRFVPTSTFRPRPPRGADLRRCSALDARHGRVLLHWDSTASEGCDLVVWDPITDELRYLPALLWSPYPYSWNAAVLCAAGAAACDHLDCHRGHFLVVVVGTNCKEMFAHVYSSEVGAWTQPTTARHPQGSIDFAPTALVGNSLYFAFQMCTTILEYNLGAQEMAVIDLPPPRIYWQRIVLTARDDGCALGFVTQEESTLYLWWRETRPEGGSQWTQSRVIELGTLLPVDAVSTFTDVVSIVGGIGIIFVRTGDGLYTIDLKSGQSTRVCKDSGFSGIFPYVSFHTPALGPGSGLDW